MITLIWMVAAVIALWGVDPVLAIIGLGIIVAKCMWASFKVIINGEC